MNDENDYTIKALSSTFATHAIKADKLHEDIKSKFFEDNPGQELPLLLTCDFNISRALSVMCCEIEKLQCRIT